MAGESHVFEASGDACGICAALNGQLVSAGYKAHDNCQCQTVPADEDSDCKWSFSHVGNDRYGDGSYDVRAGVEVEVTCADGTTFGMSGEVDVGSSNDLDEFGAALEEYAEQLADELCAQCPPPPEPNVA
jgi:hypothetical protein